MNRIKICTKNVHIDEYDLKRVANKTRHFSAYDNKNKTVFRQLTADNNTHDFLLVKVLIPMGIILF